MESALRDLVNRWRLNAPKWNIPEAVCWFRAADDLCELLNVFTQDRSIPQGLCMRSSDPPKPQPYKP